MKKMLSTTKEYFLGIGKELAKVSWPSRAVVLNYTMIVVLSAVVVMLFVSIVDFGLSKTVEYLLSLKK